jgi:DNA end-binding protein Ku
VEAELVSTLINASTGDFALDKYPDLYTSKLQQLIEAKVAGKEIVAAPASEGPQVINLMEALKQSVARVQGTNSPRKETRKTTRRLLRKIS